MQKRKYRGERCTVCTVIPYNFCALRDELLRAGPGGSYSDGYKTKNKKSEKKLAIRHAAENSARFPGGAAVRVSKTPEPPLHVASASVCRVGQSYPVSQQERRLLLSKLDPMTKKENEPRDDIRVPCNRIVMELKKQVGGL